MCCGPTDKGMEICTPQTCCCITPRHRRFLSKEEQIEMLEDYKKELEKEIHGVEQKIKEIKE
jgi:hypothetical protein